MRRGVLFAVVWLASTGARAQPSDVLPSWRGTSDAPLPWFLLPSAPAVAAPPVDPWANERPGVEAQARAYRGLVEAFAVHDRGGAHRIAELELFHAFDALDLGPVWECAASDSPDALDAAAAAHARVIDAELARDRARDAVLVQARVLLGHCLALLDHDAEAIAAYVAVLDGVVPEAVTDEREAALVGLARTWARVAGDARTLALDVSDPMRSWGDRPWRADALVVLADVMRTTDDRDALLTVASTIFALGGEAAADVVRAYDSSCRIVGWDDPRCDAIETPELELIHDAQDHHARAVHLGPHLGEDPNRDARMAEYGAALELYDAYLARYPSSPGAYEVLYGRADVLAGRERWAEAAVAFETVRDSPMDDRYAVEAARHAVRMRELALDAATVRADADDAERARRGEPVEPPEPIARLVHAGLSYLARATPDASMHLAALWLDDWTTRSIVRDELAEILHRYGWLDTARALAWTTYVEACSVAERGAIGLGQPTSWAYAAYDRLVAMARVLGDEAERERLEADVMARPCGVP